MKRFLPSSVMLIPFVVKRYPEDEDGDESSCDRYDTQNAESQLDLSTENPSAVKEDSNNLQSRKE